MDFYLVYRDNSYMKLMFRLDEKTKQIIKTWPLTTVRRWAAAPNVFTLDFGDYQDQYYSVQTTEGK
jgi:talin